MATFFASSILSCLLLAYWKRMRNSFIEIEFHNRIFQLRDELRGLVIDGKLEADDDLFRFFDLGLSRTINESYSMTLFYVMLFSVKQNEDKGFNEFKKRLEARVIKSSEVQSIRIKWAEATGKYIADQHKISFMILIPLIRSIGVLQGFSRFFKKTIDSSLISPDTYPYVDGRRLSL